MTNIPPGGEETVVTSVQTFAARGRERHSHDVWHDTHCLHETGSCMCPEASTLSEGCIFSILPKLHTDSCRATCGGFLQF